MEERLHRFKVVITPCPSLTAVPNSFSIGRKIAAFLPQSDVRVRMGLFLHVSDSNLVVRRGKPEEVVADLIKHLGSVSTVAFHEEVGWRCHDRTSPRVNNYTVAASLPVTSPMHR